MSLLYDRKYRLRVGRPDNIIYTGSSGANVNIGIVDTVQGFPLYDDSYRTEKGEGVVITDLQMIADVSSNSNTGNQAACIIKVYNLSDETRAILENENNNVILEAGYAQDEELKLIFSGQIFSYTTDKNGQDMITTIKCKDGFTPNNGIRISKYYSKTTGNRPTTYEDVLTDLVKVFATNGIPTGFLELGDITSDRQTYVQLRSPRETILGRGYSTVGFLRQAMDNVCNSLGYVWYITNGRLFCHPKGYTQMVELYEFGTDQLLSIRRTGDQTVTTSTGKGDSGVKIITFLDGRLDTDKMIRITDGKFQGDYKILTKAHSLDYRHGAWTTTVDCLIRLGFFFRLDTPP